MDKIWESLVTLKSDQDVNLDALKAAKFYVEQDAHKNHWNDLPTEAFLEKDTDPLPSTADREGYYGPNHYSYWASGLQDALNLLAACDEHNVSPKTSLDMGCASGRVMRHLAHSGRVEEVIGCDINRVHVEWCSKYLPNLTVFQNHSIPSIPLPDESVDLVSAFSVFTHIEALETAWLMELRRIMRPGAIAWLTVHTEHTLTDMKEGWPLWRAVMNHPEMGKELEASRSFDTDRLVVRWHNDRSYSSNVFYKQDYLMRTWGRYFNVVDFKRRCPKFQDVIILQKK